MTDSKQSEGLPVPAQLKRWSKSGLIEEARVTKQDLFQKEEFDREGAGDLLIENLYRAKDVKALIQDKMMELQDMENKQSNSLKLQGYREARRKLEELLEELEQ